MKRFSQVNNSQKLYFQRGFSLLELSIVLIIIALMVGFGLEAGLSTLKSSEITATRTRLDAIKDALVLYQENNDAFPCPAPRNVIPGAATFGIAESCSGAPTAGVTDVGTIRIGMVPVKTLNLPEEYARDAWNSKFTYVVTEALATTPAAYTAGTEAIVVRDGNGNAVAVTAAGADKPTAWLVISHGPDLKGAYGLRATAVGIACDATHKDGTNCDNNNSFIDTQFNDADVAASFFDDFVAWGMKL